jgi:hypothetical protein
MSNNKSNIENEMIDIDIKVQSFLKNASDEQLSIEKNETISKLKTFVENHLKDENKRIVLITSGGTTVPLEK